MDCEFSGRVRAATGVGGAAAARVPTLGAGPQERELEEIKLSLVFLQFQGFRSPAVGDSVCVTGSEQQDQQLQRENQSGGERSHGAAFRFRWIRTTGCVKNWETAFMAMAGEEDWRWVDLEFPLLDS